MQKLLQGEAARVVGILREADASILALSRVPQSASQASAVAAGLERHGREATARELELLAEAEHKYREAVRAQGGRHTGGSLYSSISLGASRAADADDGEVKAQVRAFTSALRVDLGAAALLPASTPGGSRLREFAEALRSLSEIAARRVATSKAQAEDIDVEMGNKQARIDAAERELALLREELNKQRAARTAELAEMETSLSRVREDLTTAVGTADEDLSSVRTSNSTKMTSVEEHHKKSVAATQEHVEKLTVELRAAQESHAEAEAALRKKKARSRMELEAAVKEYDTAMATLQDQIDSAEKTIAEEAPVIADFVQYYTALDAELETLARERAVEQQEERMRKAHALRRHHLSKKIARWYKTWKAYQDDKKKKAAKEAAKKK